MKRILLLLLLSLAASSGMAAVAEARSVPEQRLVNIVNGFRGTEGFEIVKIGRLGVWLMRSAASLTEAGSDPDVRQALKVMNGVRRLVVVEYGDGPERERRLFNDRISSALSNSDLLMSVNDGGSSVSIYGTPDEKTGDMRDMVIFTPDDCALVCVFGRISMEAVVELLKDI